jgi:hypothetical protein
MEQLIKMNVMTLYRLTRIAWLLCLVLTIAGCSSDEISSPLPDDGEIKPGDPVMFTTHIPSKGQTRTIEKDDAFTGYSEAANDYAITIEMYRQSDGAKVGEGNYTTTNGDGTLVVAPSGSQLYWPDNTQAYGFKATAGTETLDADQSTRAKYLLQDQLLGYAFVPLKDTENPETPQYTVNDLNYKTSKQWKTANANFGVTDPEDQKIIPLYLNHLRSRITVILVAGNGVNAKELAFATASTNIAATIYSYGSSNLSITPYAITVDEGNSTQYTAIVEPHNYSSQNIVTINLSGQSVSYPYTYNLTAGQHLILTLTLTRAESFQVLMKAQITGWDDVEPSLTLDDLGQVIN